MNLHTIFLAACITYCTCQFTDEMQVYESECLGEDKFPCMSGGCISHSQYCDGIVDCDDGTDENFCLEHKPDVIFCDTTHQYLCRDQKKCIPSRWICNGVVDCDDATDEANCTSLPEQKNDSVCKGFKCGDGKCISNLWVCDGVYDCNDKSDEYNQDLCRQVSLPHAILDGTYCQEFPSHGERNYMCLDTSYCLPAYMMCDGMPDCRDGSDEGTFCANWHTMCNNHYCHGNDTKCSPERTGPTCLCFSSPSMKYNLVNQKCEDVNECLLERPLCSHICVNTDGHYSCECDAGYSKDDLMYLCFAGGPEAKLFFTTRNEIKYLKIKTKELVTIATGVKEAHGVSFDGTYLYWVETARGHQSIFKAQLDDVKDSKQVLVGLGLEDPGDIAVDWLGGNIYFSDSERGIISACRADGSICTTIRTDTKNPKFVTLDAKNGKMYWADWHRKPVIMTSSMDGSNPEVLVDVMETFASGLALDAPNERLYFVDKTIKVVMIKQKHVYPLFEERFHYPYSVAVFENTVFWSDWTSNTIQTTDKLHGTKQKRNVLLTLDRPIFGMHIYHPALMNTTVNPCRNNNCSHLCFVTSNTTHVCGCPDNMEMKDNVCHHTSTYRPKYLIVAGGQLVTRIQYDTLGNPESHATHLDIDRVQAMAYDSHRDCLYLYDGKKKTINYINMSDFTLGITHLLLFDNLENVVDMDYDYVTDSLYILDAGHRLIEVVSLPSRKRAVVYRFEDHEVPISFCVLTDTGRMLVAVVENELHNNIHIDSLGLDGVERRHVIMNNLKGPHIRLRHVAHMNSVFISDEGNGAIDVMHPEGAGRENYRQLSTTITSLAIAGNYVFWTDRRTSRLFWSDIHDTTHKIRRIDLAIFPNNTQLLVQATTQKPDSKDPLLFHPCVHLKPCSDICVQSPHLPPYEFPFHLDFKCLCPTGLVLNGVICSKLMSCKKNELYCHRSNSCFPATGRCNGRKDCVYGEDEEGCNFGNICADHEVYCNGVCINKDIKSVCNKKTVAPIPEVCSSTTEFLCENSAICLSRSRVCDGYPDCPDGSDERMSECDTLSCFDTEFMCASGSCILKTWTCDGDEDCNDGSDELNCVNTTCAPGFYQCQNKACVELKKRCDGKQDCLDASDEKNCDEPTVVEFNEEAPQCAIWEYACELNKSICLPRTARCNFHIDCPGGTDEDGCESRCSSRGLFACVQQLQCVTRNQLCDGHNDCVDGSDETPDACATVNKTSHLYLPPSQPHDDCSEGYLCDNGQCIEWQQVCNRKLDCRDGSDENGYCPNACQNFKCQFICHPTPRGPKCLCPVGYYFDIDHMECTDRDECLDEVCSQNCTNIPGSFVCSCHHGYAIRSDRHSCKATRGSMSILYASGNTVRSITANGYGVVEYSDPNVPVITDLDFNVRQNKLYVTSVAASKLIEVNNSPHEVVAVTNVGRPTRVAVDWVTGNTYFVDSSPTASFIRVCNVKRKRCAKLQKLPSNAAVTALIVDPNARRMFYCIYRDLESVVWSSFLSGRHVTDLTTVQNCTGLAVDSFKRKLYVAETGPARITRMDYKGENHKKILANHSDLKDPQGLAIFEDYIYFLTDNSYRLNRCLLYGSKHCETYIYRVFNTKTFAIRHPSIQRDDIKDLCEDFVCSNVCALDDVGPMCVCDDGSLSKDGGCPLVKKEMLPLFNGRTYQESVFAYHVSYTLITALLVLLILFLIVYYHCVYKPRRRAATYTEVRYRTSQDSGPSSSNPAVEMTAEVITHEFVNPLQYVRNMWNRSIRKRTRPTFSPETVQSSASPQDLSDTESDLVDRETMNVQSK